MEIQDGVIKSVKERKNKLIRPSVANVDNFIIVVANPPAPDYFLFDKLISTAYSREIPCQIVVNKVDCDKQTAEKIIENYKNAVNAGLSVGAYYFVGRYCKSAESGVADAQRFYDIIKNLKLDYPVYIDFEAPNSSNKQGNTDAVNAFCLYMLFNLK